jgi:sugar lactone lactonase YvrE
MLKPLALNCLAYPTGLALSQDESMIYVCEMSTNRLLRFFQKPTGVFHYSVFYQFSGGVGPTCAAVDKYDRIYVGHLDVGTDSGKISEIDREGNLVREIRVPGASITGLTITPSSDFLIVAESTTSSIIRIPLTEI